MSKTKKEAAEDQNRNNGNGPSPSHDVTLHGKGNLNVQGWKRESQDYLWRVGQSPWSHLLGAFELKPPLVLLEADLAIT